MCTYISDNEIILLAGVNRNSQLILFSSTSEVYDAFMFCPESDYDIILDDKGEFILACDKSTNVMNVLRITYESGKVIF